MQHLCTVAGNVNGVVAMETIWFLKKLNTEFSYSPAIPLLKSESRNFSLICTSMFIAALFTIVNKWKQPKCSLTDEHIKKTQIKKIYI